MSCRCRRRSSSRVRPTRVSPATAIADISRSGNAVAGQGGEARGGLDGIAASVGGFGGFGLDFNLLSKNSLGGIAVSALNFGGLAVDNNQNANFNVLTAFTVTDQDLTAAPTIGGDAGLAIGGDANSSSTAGNGGDGAPVTQQSNGGFANGGNAKAKARARG